MDDKLEKPHEIFTMNSVIDDMIEKKRQLDKILKEWND
jgi:hypothetical protein